MKSLFVFPICLLFIFSSCKKSGGGVVVPFSGLSATVDGVNLNFGTNSTAHRDSAIAGVLNIAGETAVNGARQYIQISVELNNPNNPVTAGTYVSSGYAANAGTASIFYDNIISDVPNNQDFVKYLTFLNSNNITTVIVSSISSTNVQGTFSGKLPLVNGDTTTMKVITNGKFNLAVVN